ncbi:MAG: hypothetical protein ACP6IS_12525 [Candidatus Asgardarchaeia archaeon]
MPSKRKTLVFKLLIIFLILALIPLISTNALLLNTPANSIDNIAAKGQKQSNNLMPAPQIPEGPLSGLQEAQDSSFVKIEFPITFIYATLGNFIGDNLPELAGVSYHDGRVYFFDFYRNKVISINNDTYSSQQAYNGIAIATANLDTDSYDELFYLNLTGYLFLIDNDATTLKREYLSIAPPIYDDNIIFFNAIDLDGDGYDDPIIAISTSSESLLLVIDGATKQLAGSLNFTTSTIRSVTVGEFNANTGLEIAVAYVNYSIAIYTKSMTRLAFNNLPSFTNCIITVSNSSWHYDAIAGLFYTPDRIELYNATTLTSMGLKANVSFYNNVKPVVGDFDKDSSPEIAIPTRGYGMAIYDVNSNETTSDFLLFSKVPTAITAGMITADNTDDIVIASSDNAFAFKGIKGSTQIKLLRRMDEPTGISKVTLSQYDSGLKDIFIITWSALYVYISDSNPPRISDVSTYPLRPTVDDAYISVSAVIDDISPLEGAMIVYNFTKADGTVTTLNGIVKIVPETHAGKVYAGYFINLVAGEYTFKIVAKDIYDNIVVEDNNGTNFSVTVYSKVIFSQKMQSDILEAKKPIAVGNLDNDALSDVAVALKMNITVIYGNNTVIAPITYKDNIEKPEIYLMNLDNVPGDDIVFYFTNKTTSKQEINVYKGSSFELLRSYIFDHDIKHIVSGDINNDGLNELVIVEEVNLSLSRILIITPQTNTTIKELFTDPVYDIKIFNITDHTPDIAMVTINASSHIDFNLTVLAGENNLQKVYSYTNSSPSVINDVEIYYDRFLQTPDKQLLVFVISYTPYGYLINATTGEIIETRHITYSTGFAIIDYNFDGIKEYSFLIYDNSLVIRSFVDPGLYIKKDALVPTTPYKVFYTNFDDDPHPDLVYVLNDRISIYSLYDDRYEEIDFPYRLIADAEIGNFFDLPFSDICVVSFDSLVEKYINYNVFYRAKVDVHLSGTEVLQGDTLNLRVNIRNVFGDAVAISDVMSELYLGSTVITSSSFTSLGNGTYILSLAATNLPIGIYKLGITASDPYYGNYQYNYNITVRGDITGLISMPESVKLGGYLLANVTLIDTYGFPVFEASVEITIESNTYTPFAVIRNMYLFKISTENQSIGEKLITIRASHPLAVKPLSINTTVALIGEPEVVIVAEGINRPPVVQGETIHLKLDVYDDYMHPVTGCTIVAYLFGMPYTFTDLGNGTYIAMISTINLPGGVHRIFFELSHDYLMRKTAVTNITIISKPVLTYVIEPRIIQQGSTMNITMQLTDVFGYPIEGATILVEFRGRTYEAINIKNNTYFVSIEIGDIKYGPQQLNITITGENIDTVHITEFKIFIYPKIPKLDLSPQALLTMLVISIGASIVGLMLYYIISARLVRSFTVDERGRLVMDYKPLDRIYLLFTVLMFMTLGAAGFLYIRKLYELAVSTLGLALLEILLVYGIWLYRDAAYTLVTEKLPLIRMILGFWHLVLAPAIIFGIFWWGEKIDWFAFYILKDTVNVGGIIVPSIYISLMGTYVTSIIVLSFNIYLNSRRYKNRFAEMRAGGTPENVINDEKVIQLDRMSSSIRIKFFVFLAILGASLVSTASPLLQYYQLGLVVILPLVFIIVIPYVVSRILKFLGFAKRVTKRIAILSVNRQ